MDLPTKPESESSPSVACPAFGSTYAPTATAAVTESSHPWASTLRVKWRACSPPPESRNLARHCPVRSLGDACHRSLQEPSSSCPGPVCLGRLTEVHVDPASPALGRRDPSTPGAPYPEALAVVDCGSIPRNCRPACAGCRWVKPVANGPRVYPRRSTMVCLLFARRTMTLRLTTFHRQPHATAGHAQPGQNGPGRRASGDHPFAYALQEGPGHSFEGQAMAACAATSCCLSPAAFAACGSVSSNAVSPCGRASGGTP
jgi:hypothetical protein